MMNRQPYKTPPRWWSPQPNATWINFWCHWRKRRGLREHALNDIEIRNLERVRNAMDHGGTLITPNHPSHADPFVMLAAADELQSPLYFMTAWQVFANTHFVGRSVLRQHGCFSVNREGNDVHAVRQAVKAMELADAPLVIFPEGEVYHLNDRVTSFRRGAVQSAIWAANRAGKPVSIVPCGLKFAFTDDPIPALEKTLTRLEDHVGCTRSSLPLVARIKSFGEFMLTAHEQQVIGARQNGTMGTRVGNLIEAILQPLEDRYHLTSQGTIPERIKRLRCRLIWHMETPSMVRAEPMAHDDLQADLDRLFVATQFYSYRVDYLAGNPSIERVAETIDKLAEDVLGMNRVAPPATRRAIVDFGEPIMIAPDRYDKTDTLSLTNELQRRVQSIVDRINESLLLSADNSPAVRCELVTA
jgi:1-acyl-sn-glycerol-3-phosphate acyltransferase